MVSDKEKKAQDCDWDAHCGRLGYIAQELCEQMTEQKTVSIRRLSQGRASEVRIGPRQKNRQKKALWLRM